MSLAVTPKVACSRSRAASAAPTGTGVDVALCVGGSGEVDVAVPGLVLGVALDGTAVLSVSSAPQAQSVSARIAQQEK
jgi:hypothetical protein